jgi:hypothetical protein
VGESRKRRTAVMKRSCAVVAVALMLGVVTPDAGVAQGAGAHASQADSTAVDPGAEDSFSVRGGPRADTPDSHRAEMVSYEVDPFAAVVPFGPGERLEYNVKLGIFNAGEAHMEVLGIDSVRGAPTYHIDVAMEGGLLFGAFGTDSRFESWLDTELLSSRRYISDESYTGYSSYRSFQMYPEEMRWHQTDEDVHGELATALPLDDISFIYFVRSLPLEVGQTYTLSRYFKKEGNPVVIEVERRAEREVGAGTFNTIVVRPTIQTDGLFEDGGEAELHFSDDENRYLVYMRVGMPVVGSITLHLENIIPGTPIHAGAAAW